MPDNMISIDFSLSKETKLLGIALVINPTVGWGNYALNLFLQLQQIPGFTPIVLLIPNGVEHLNPLYKDIVLKLIKEQQQIQRIIFENQTRQINLNIPVLHPLTDQFSLINKNIHGSQNVAFDFSLDTHITPEALVRAKEYNLIVAGSSWNGKLLQSYQINNVYTILQGIDPSKFHPAPKANLFKNRFVIFSGGKLEYRKGQDIVVEVFKRFVARHRDALLLTAWHNHWPSTMLGIEDKGYVQGMPQLTQEGKLLIKEWLIANGVPDDACIDLGLVPNDLMPPVMREADVAIFPNRAEGGTNLVAMECLACGLPTILSANTGHLDLVGDEHCYSLKSQSPAKRDRFNAGAQGWGESDVEEALETLEHIYNNRKEAEDKGSNAAIFMQDMTWEKQIKRMYDLLVQHQIV